jgi:hypothetical protein
MFTLETAMLGAVWSGVSSGMGWRTGGSRPLTRHQREVYQIDRRWLITWLASFVASLALFFGVYAIYKATGPHPQVTVFLRAVRHEVRWLIPGLKKKPNAKDGVFRRDPSAPRWAAAEHDPSPAHRADRAAREDVARSPGGRAAGLA